MQTMIQRMKALATKAETGAFDALESTVTANGFLKASGWTNSSFLLYSTLYSMITNFHMPKSSVMIMAASFAG